MEGKSVLLPTREKKATLVDLLDRVLEKGLVIHADIIISVAGIPLIGINLRAALAGMETMLKYGMMRDWDERTRQWEREHAKRREPAFWPEEKVLLRMYGAHWYSKGIYRAWRPGQLYLTDKRLFLFRPEPGEMLFETRLEKVKGLAVKRETHFTGVERDMLYLVSNPDRVVHLYAENPAELVAVLEARTQSLGINLDGDPVIPILDPEVDRFLGQEEVAADGKMWHQVPSDGIMGETWRAGWLYMTSERLLWWCAEDRKVLVEVPLEKIAGATIETKDLGGMIKDRSVLCLSYQNQNPYGEKMALFAGDKLAEWQAALGRVAEEIETCPRCDRPAPVKQLLGAGCTECGWTSPGTGSPDRGLAVLPE